MIKIAKYLILFVMLGLLLVGGTAAELIPSFPL